PLDDGWPESRASQSRRRRRASIPIDLGGMGGTGTRERPPGAALHPGNPRHGWGTNSFTQRPIVGVADPRQQGQLSRKNVEKEVRPHHPRRYKGGPQHGGALLPSLGDPS